MSIEQLEQEVAKLERVHFARFAAWFDEFRAQAWDQQIAEDAGDGKFDSVFADIDAELRRGEIRAL